MKTDELSGFEQRLLTELKQVVAERPEPVASPAAGLAARRRIAWRPRLALVAAGIAAAVAVLLALDGDKAGPAYAVTAQDDGTVRVEYSFFRSAKDAEAMERELEELGIRAEVDYVASGTRCQRARYVPASDVQIKSAEEESNGKSSVVFIVDPADFEQDRTLVIEGARLTNGGQRQPGGAGSPLGAQTMGVAQGAVKPCEAS